MFHFPSTSLSHDVFVYRPISYPSDRNELDMFCYKCQEIVNLDILLTTLVNRPGDQESERSEVRRRRPHHENIAALITWAEKGCTICSLVRAISSSRPGPFPNGPEGQLFFKFDQRRDVVVFESSIESPYSQDWSMGFCAIRLSAIEGM